MILGAHQVRDEPDGATYRVRGEVEAVEIAKLWAHLAAREHWGSQVNSCEFRARNLHLC